MFKKECSGICTKELLNFVVSATSLWPGEWRIDGAPVHFKLPFYLVLDIVNGEMKGDGRKTMTQGIGILRLTANFKKALESIP